MYIYIYIYIYGSRTYMYMRMLAYAAKLPARRDTAANVLVFVPLY